MITNTLLICSSRSSSCTETSKICSIEGSTFYDSIRQNNCIPRWTAEPEIQCYHIERSLFANFQIYCMDQSCFVPTVPERKARSKALSTAYNTHHGDAYSYLVPLVQPYQEATRCWTFQSENLRSSCCKVINQHQLESFRINQIDYRNRHHMTTEEISHSRHSELCRKSENPSTIVRWETLQLPTNVQKSLAIKDPLTTKYN